ncbi:MAG: hypothetical protein ACI8RZ_004951 [Myxococcota bacterium]|jgi:hypothetical protein
MIHSVPEAAHKTRDPVAEKLTVQKQEYNLLLKSLNFLAGAAWRMGIPGKMTAESILGAAKKRTGLSDWGGEEFRVALSVLLKHMSSAPLSSLGRTNAYLSMVQAAANRLNIARHIKDNPHITDIPVKRPLFILGFPRTGTTLLQNLLALDPSRRALRFWELVNPVPVSPDRDIDEKKRLRSAKRLLSFAYLIAPEMKYVHEIRADTTEECWPLFSNTFAVMNYDLQSSLSGVGDWLMQSDMTGPYREYRRQLQLISNARPGVDFVLKCPEHLWFLDALLEVFPDACIVWTHRDPVASVASYCSLLSLNQRMLYGRFEPLSIGQHITERFDLGLRRAMAAREGKGRPGQFFDVSFHELVADPTGMVHRIHDHFDIATPDGMDTAMDDWLNNGRNDKRGQHHYSAERYGLDVAQIHRQYGDYIERFNIQVKKP